MRTLVVLPFYRSSSCLSAVLPYLVERCLQERAAAPDAPQQQGHAPPQQPAAVPAQPLEQPAAVPACPDLVTTTLPAPEDPSADLESLNLVGLDDFLVNLLDGEDWEPEAGHLSTLPSFSDEELILF